MTKLTASTYRSTFTIITVLLIGVLFVQFTGVTDNQQKPGKQLVDQRVNLALRRTAHHLLANMGDTTTRIPPVQHPDAQTYLVRLERNIDYDQLPALLSESFKLHQVTGNYDVTVVDCKLGEVQLGYNNQDLLDNESVACIGRSRLSGCYNLQVTFTKTDAFPEPINRWWFLAGSGLLMILLFTVYRRTSQAPDPQTVPTPTPHVPVPDLSEWLAFGNSKVDSTNQKLVSGTAQHDLTYREAKLLRLFIGHQNQVLDRDFILKSVWEDEGIFVGRSVDVFVSRLRKLLQTDPTIRIVAVHGVGYRMEIRPVDVA